MEIKRVNILGVGVSAIDMQQTLAVFAEWIRGEEQRYVCVTPAHAIMDCYSDPELRRVFNASGLTTPDGMAIVWLLRLHGEKNVGRVYGPELMQRVCAHSVENGWRHYLYGGEPGVAEALRSRLEADFPGLHIVGSYSPPFRPLTDDEERQVVSSINAAKADIVWVGIGSPRQERWMSEHVTILNASVLVGVGAAFDFLTGRKRQAPRWAQRLGLEWLFRLSTEPRRLWPRYARYPMFVLLVLIQLLGLRRFSLGK